MNYVVQPGDTLNAIAARFGVPVQELIRVNNIPAPYYIYIGQNIYVPIRPPVPTPPPTTDIDRRIRRLDERMDRAERNIRDLDRRVDRLEQRVTRLEARPRPRTT
ncbi:LysM peptidoglycan-binding domain-containing protein [Brevibacillus composti]|uniref:LysM peptidoglycan-binding domain-containing protein n=1 Tax=Brevibacillus composti TaxID=2796470 RepID=A0A7T5EI15_9BACL|nr:LysM domain-containing protein [Brevibacillus composti]QQE73000.1 LysM peptidoglycan-binding domain-containing protein [Brevibacillus composti]QUO40078.1 LysM peptidoglycan-binding domain-containing protein [Brevibacillus composti]